MSLISLYIWWMVDLLKLSPKLNLGNKWDCPRQTVCKVCVNFLNKISFIKKSLSLCSDHVNCIHIWLTATWFASWIHIAQTNKQTNNTQCTYTNTNTGSQPIFTSSIGLKKLSKLTIKTCSCHWHQQTFSLQMFIPNPESYIIWLNTCS